MSWEHRRATDPLPRSTIRTNHPLCVAGPSWPKTWPDGQTIVDVSFWDNGAAEGTIPVQHSKLADRTDVEAKRTIWRAALARLAAQLAS